MKSSAHDHGTSGRHQQREEALENKALTRDYFIMADESTLARSELEQMWGGETCVSDPQIQTYTSRVCSGIHGRAHGGYTDGIKRNKRGWDNTCYDRGVTLDSV